jgi:D-beta-D-heptose 7-phosphate kinase/D-beta-D-heptose 1-phosphate adenosyltransferase
MSLHQELEQIVSALSNARVLVVGDIMLDTYQWCEVKRISPEAPVPIASVTDESFFLGGAGNVAHNVRALGAQVSLMGVVGDDAEGKMVEELLAREGIMHDGIRVDRGRPTTVKRRIFSGIQQLLRVDREVTENVSHEIVEVLHTTLSQKIKECDVLILSDYCKGVLTDDFIAAIKELAHAQGRKFFVDSKSKHLLKYADAYLVKPNKEEAEFFAKEKFDATYTNLESIGKKLCDVFKSNVVITLGGDGMALFEGETFLHKTTTAQQVFDVSGAGDTVLSVIATAVAAGASLDHAVTLSNIAAGHVVSRLGTTVCDAATLREKIMSTVS